MDLRNWETFTLSGDPVVGATVEVREATLTHPNTGSVISSTTTTVDGMWEFLGLSDSPKDVKIIYLSRVKWLKGLTKHSIDVAQGSDFTPANQNLLLNGGLDVWRRGADSILTLGASANGRFAAGWDASTGTGDTLVITREDTIDVTDSHYSAKAVYNKGAGEARLYQTLHPSLSRQLRGKTLALSAQVRQGVASNVQAFITENGVTTFGSAVATVGSFVTLSVVRAVNVASTSVIAGIRILDDDTVYLDNAMLVIGSVVPAFSPRAAGEEADQQTYEMMPRVYARHMLFR